MAAAAATAASAEPRKRRAESAGGSDAASPVATAVGALSVRVDAVASRVAAATHKRVKANPPPIASSSSSSSAAAAAAVMMPPPSPLIRSTSVPTAPSTSSIAASTTVPAPGSVPAVSSWLNADHPLLQPNASGDDRHSRVPVCGTEISRLWPQSRAVDPATGLGRGDFFPFATRDSIQFLTQSALWRFDKFKHAWTVANQTPVQTTAAAARRQHHSSAVRLPAAADLSSCKESGGDAVSVASMWNAAVSVDGIVYLTVGDAVFRFDANQSTYTCLYRPAAATAAGDLKASPPTAPVASSAAASPYHASFGSFRLPPASSSSAAAAAASAPVTPSACPGIREQPCSASSSSELYLYGGTQRTSEYAVDRTDLWRFQFASQRWTRMDVPQSPAATVCAERSLATESVARGTASAATASPSAAAADASSGAEPAAAAVAVDSDSVFVASPDESYGDTIVHDPHHNSLYLFGWNDGTDDAHVRPRLYEFDCTSRRWSRRTLHTQTVTPESSHSGELKRVIRRQEYNPRGVLLYPIIAVDGTDRVARDRPSLVVPVCFEPIDGGGGQTFTLLRIDLGTGVLTDESKVVSGWPVHGMRLCVDAPQSPYPTSVWAVGEDAPDDRRTVFFRVELKADGGLNAVWPSAIADVSILDAHTLEGHDFSSLTFDNRIFQFGGKTTQRGCVVSIYNSATNAFEWTRPKTIDEAETTYALPKPRLTPSVTVDERSAAAYMTGGRVIRLEETSAELAAPNTKLTTDSLVHRYDLRAWKWLTPLDATVPLPPAQSAAAAVASASHSLLPPSARIGHATFVYGGKLYVWGGLTPEQWTHWRTVTSRADGTVIHEPAASPTSSPLAAATGAVAGENGAAAAAGAVSSAPATPTLTPTPAPALTPTAITRSTSLTGAAGGSVRNVLDFFEWDNRLHALTLESTTAASAMEEDSKVHTPSPSTDVKSGVWSVVRSNGAAPVGRIEFAYAVLEHFFFVFGGWVGCHASPAEFVVHRFDLRTSQWSVDPCTGRMPTATPPLNAYRAIPHAATSSILVFDVSAAAASPSDDPTAPAAPMPMPAVMYQYDTEQYVWHSISLSEPILGADASFVPPRPRAYSVLPAPAASSGAAGPNVSGATVLVPVDQRHYHYTRRDARLSDAHRTSLIADLQCAFNTSAPDAACDVVITHDSEPNRPIRAHAAVLSARSPFFCQLLQSPALYRAVHGTDATGTGANPRSSPPQTPTRATSSAAASASGSVMFAVASTPPQSPIIKSSAPIGSPPASPLVKPLSLSGDSVAAPAVVLSGKIIKPLERTSSSAAAAAASGMASATASPRTPREASQSIVPRRIRISGGGGSGGSATAWDELFDAIGFLYSGISTLADSPIRNQLLGARATAAPSVARSLLHFVHSCERFPVGSDEVICVVDGGAYRVHRPILAARSPFFRALLSSPFASGYSGDGTFHLSGISNACFVRVIEFLNSDNISAAKQHSQPQATAATAPVAQHSSELSMDDLLALLDAAALYGIPNLLAWAEQRLIAVLSSPSAVDAMPLVAVAHKYQLTELWRVAIARAKPTANSSL